MTHSVTAPSVHTVVSTSESQTYPIKIHAERSSVSISLIATRLRRGRTTALTHAFAIASAFAHLLLFASLICTRVFSSENFDARTQIQIDVMIDGNWIDYV